ncbi:hypothetical protein GCM10023115_30710 [Pontixanthobacter gangjinensis]
MFALLITACSKDENEPLKQNETDELIDLSLNINILDVARNSESRQQVIELPDCSEAAPFYIEIIMKQGDREVVGTADTPFRLDLAPGQMFTKYDPAMAMPAGLYFLDHCAVFDEAGNLLCLAPKADSPMGPMSDAPMPMSINLRAGSKPFPDVPVLCFDNRDVNEYGYAFFDIVPTRIQNFCFFANYCSDTGKHYPARYSLDLSVEGVNIYSNEISTTGQYDTDGYFADPVCVDIPILSKYEEDEEYIDYTLTLLPWDDVYGFEEEMVITGSLSREDIEEFLTDDGNIEYKHIFFNCEDEEDIPLPDFEAASFSNPTNITNPFYGPRQQFEYLYEGYELEDGEMPDEPSEVIFVERRLETKEILGINTVIQRDYVSEDGVINEDTDDWLAQDDDGNLWYMGELSKNYDEDGNFIGTEGSWEAGVDGALPGYWLPADPYVGQRYYQEFYEGEAEDWAEVIALDATVELEIGSFSNVLVTKDVNPFEPGVYELKYYAPGTGFIKEEKYEDGELVEVVFLTGIIVID